MLAYPSPLSFHAAEKGGGGGGGGGDGPSHLGHANGALLFVSQTTTRVKDEGVP